MLEILLVSFCTSFALLVLSIVYPLSDAPIRERLGGIALAAIATLVTGVLLALVLYQTCGTDFTCYR